MTDPLNTAHDRFEQGYSCSQAVFSAFAPEFGIDDGTALKLASPFGGGIAQRGHVCGAVTGALMVIGLRGGNPDPESKEQNLVLPQKFIKRFEEKHGSLICRELTGYDVSDPEELQAARESGVFDSKCPGLVKDAVEIIAEIFIE